MSVLAQAFLTLVRSHFMSFSLLSARHSSNYLLMLVFTRFRKVLEGLKAGI